MAFNLFSYLENKVLELLSPILGPLRPLIVIFTKLRDNTIGIFDAATQLISSTEDTYGSIVNFTINPKFSTRVINVPRVAANVEELAAAPGKIIAAIKDLIQQLKNKVDPAAFEVDELEGLEDLRSIVTRFGSRIAQGFEKILGIVTIVVDALVTIRSSISDLQAIVDGVQTIVDDLSDLEGLFLPQGNKRKPLALADGGTIKVRLGNLHS